MSRWQLFVPLAALVAAGVALALLLGARAVSTTETEAIERVAALHMAAGGARLECHAVPAVSEGLWLVVTCAGPRGGAEYFVDHFGRVVDKKNLKDGV